MENCGVNGNAKCTCSEQCPKYFIDVLEAQGCNRFLRVYRKYRLKLAMTRTKTLHEIFSCDALTKLNSLMDSVKTMKYLKCY